MNSPLNAFQFHFVSKFVIETAWLIIYVQVGSENGSRDAAESDDEDDAYWSQYDHFNGPAVSANIPKTGTPSDQDETSYYEQYNEVETAVAGDKDVSAKGASGTEPMFGADEVKDGLEDYLRATVRNLCQLAKRCGMSQKKFTTIISEEIADL